MSAENGEKVFRSSLKNEVMSDSLKAFSRARFYNWLLRIAVISISDITAGIIWSW